MGIRRGKKPFKIVRMKYLMLLLAMVWSGLVSAQKENNFWIFGLRTGVDLNSGNPSAVSSGIAYCGGGGIVTTYCIYAGFASVADRHTGELLFYSDGKFAYDRNHQIMPGSSIHWGNGSSFRTGLSGVAGHNGRSEYVGVAQGALIVPVIGDTSKYYLFSLGPEKGEGSLYYSIVDMNLRGGMGDVIDTRKNILLDAGKLSEGMVAVQGNNCDLWVVVHEVENPVFRAYRITVNGINPTPVISRAGTQIEGPAVFGHLWGGAPRSTRAYDISVIDVSPDRNYLAITSRSRAEDKTFFYLDRSTANVPIGTLVCRFDPNTGVVSDGIVLEKWKWNHSAVFSPDNTKLYISAYEDNAGEVLQFDLQQFDQASVEASRQSITPNMNINGFKGMRRFNDKIYTAGDSSLFTQPGYTNTLSVIEFPDASGVAAGYRRNIAELSPSTWTYGSLSTPVVYHRNRDTVYAVAADTVVCVRTDLEMEAWEMTLEATPGFTSYRWDDGSTTSTRLITEPGTYWVWSRDHCNNRIDTFIVRQGMLTEFTLGGDTVLCNQDRFVLRAPVSADAYRWQDGSGEASFEVRENGIYILEIMNGAGCRSSDTIRVTLKDLRQDLGTDQLYCSRELISLTLGAHITPSSSVLWNTGATGRELYVTDSGTYSVWVTDGLCSATDTVRIAKQVCDCAVYLPTAFSPNGDGRNDHFRPVIENGCEVRGFIINVYDRWGSRIYTGNDPDAGWDGNVKGRPAEIGVYMYEIHFRGGAGDQVRHFKGDINLIR